MRHSAQIQVHFKSYQRFGGALDLNAYMKMAGWLKRSWISIQTLPRASATLSSTKPDIPAAWIATLIAYQAAGRAPE